MLASVLPTHWELFSTLMFLDQPFKHENPCEIPSWPRPALSTPSPFSIMLLRVPVGTSRVYVFKAARTRSIGFEASA